LYKPAVGAEVRLLNLNMSRWFQNLLPSVQAVGEQAAKSSVEMARPAPDGAMEFMFKPQSVP
jgi:hypothetical protein